MSYFIKQQFISMNRPQEPFINLKGIVVHSTANIGATAQNHFNYWNNADRQSSVQYIADWIGEEILNLIPENEIAWHTGSWQGNREWLGIEMCETDDPAEFDIVWNKTVWFVADLCIRKGWNVNDNVWSHNGLRTMYKGVDHTDPYNYLERMGKSWTQFCDAIENKIIELKNPNVVAQPTPIVVPPSQPSRSEPIPTPSTGEIYRVKVNSSQLSAWSNKSTAISEAEKQYNSASPNTRITIERKSDSGLEYDKTKPVPYVAPVAQPKPIPVVMNWSYPRNAKATGKIPVTDVNGIEQSGRWIDPNDELVIIDISGSRQIVELEYPTPSGVRHGYIKVASNIKFNYSNEWRNGSTKENVYGNDGSLIGSLNAKEYASPLFKIGNRLAVAYSIGNGKWKSGNVDYDGGFGGFN